MVGPRRIGAALVGVLRFADAVCQEGLKTWRDHVV